MTHPRGWTGKEGMAGTLFCGTDGMNDIAAIFGRMEANCPAPSSTSRKLWQLRRATTIRPDNARSETMLEKAVAMLSTLGGVPGPGAAGAPADADDQCAAGSPRGVLFLYHH